MKHPVAAASGGRTCANAADTVDDSPVAAREPVDESLDEHALQSFRALLLSGERYRQVVSSTVGLGTTESRALAYLAIHGQRTQGELARDLCVTSSAATAIVDRIERQGVAERVRHPHDRRRIIVRLTARGQDLVDVGQQPLVECLAALDPACLAVVASAMDDLARDLHARIPHLDTVALRTVAIPDASSSRVGPGDGPAEATETGRADPHRGAATQRSAASRRAADRQLARGADEVGGGVQGGQRDQDRLTRG